MMARIFMCSTLLAGVASSTYVTLALAGQPEQLWFPVVTMLAFVVVSGLLWTD